MNHILACVLTLLFSMSGPAMGKNSDFCRSSFAADTGATTLYRAVSRAELEDISATGGFRAGGGSMGNKWFAETPGDAAAWGKSFYRYDQEPVFTLQVKVPNSAASQMMRNPSLDGIGPARSASDGLLDIINQKGTIKVLNGNVLPTGG